MSSERSVKDLSGPYTGFMERAMGIEPTSESWDRARQGLSEWESFVEITGAQNYGEGQGWEGQGAVSLRKDIPCALRNWDSSIKFLTPSAEGMAEPSDQTKEEPSGNWDSLFRRESSELRWY